MAAQQRPLSPHLQVYRPQITTVMSIVHRATGMLLALGALALAVWLCSLAGAGDCYASFQYWAESWIGKAALFAFSAALVYHLLNGLRHLLWDIGWGFEIPQFYRSGYTVLALSVLFTALIWFSALSGGAA